MVKTAANLTEAQMDELARHTLDTGNTGLDSKQKSHLLVAWSCLPSPRGLCAAPHKQKNRLTAVVLFGVPTGIRTPVTAVKGRCPRPLDDGDLRAIQALCGGGNRDRTGDLLHAMQALSQLSYTPTQGGGL